MPCRRSCSANPGTHRCHQGHQGRGQRRQGRGSRRRPRTALRHRQDGAGMVGGVAIGRAQVADQQLLATEDVEGEETIPVVEESWIEPSTLQLD